MHNPERECDSPSRLMSPLAFAMGRSGFVCRVLPDRKRTAMLIHCLNPYSLAEPTPREHGERRERAAPTAARCRRAGMAARDYAVDCHLDPANMTCDGEDRMAVRGAPRVRPLAYRLGCGGGGE